MPALAGACGHWTFVSSVSVYADLSIPGRAAESTPLLEPVAAGSTDADLRLYGRSKVACEDVVRQRFGERPLVVRPGLIVGPDDPNDRFGPDTSRLPATDR